MKMRAEVVVIYDGQCDFCWQSITWVRKRCEIKALAYQSSDLDQYGLTEEECAKRVYVIADGQRYAAAAAIAYLLNHRGNKVAGFLLRKSGPIGEFGYRQVAGNRGSRIVKAIGNFLRFLNSR
jgi:predicted DCC family thiol-disulfide oxidoreductase YuxK|uniref:DCC1-like thiol-disulfide oxidoreductase family protein n=2 Tax=Candidatus Planktophila sp. TaxID=2175601 RepID=UPI00404B7D9A